MRSNACHRETSPEPGEIRQCNRYLAEEISEFAASGSALLALGAIAHQAVLMALGLKLKSYPFSHGAIPHASRRGFGWHTKIHRVDAI